MSRAARETVDAKVVGTELVSRPPRTTVPTSTLSNTVHMRDATAGQREGQRGPQTRSAAASDGRQPSSLALPPVAASSQGSHAAAGSP